MPPRAVAALGLWGGLLAGLGAAIAAQGAGSFMGSTEDPAIRYLTAPLDNVVADANRRLQEGTLQLRFDGRSGYLRSALEALDIPVDSQLLVFSRTSLQARRIGEQNPRALFFNDRVALGWVRDGDMIEVAAHDASAGVVFYTLDQTPEAAGRPRFTRAVECLGCHLAGDTLGVPGLLMFSSSRPAVPGGVGLPKPVNQNTALRERFGGWFVTGRTAAPHMGNQAAAVDGRASGELASVEGLFDPDGFPASSSDIAAHLVLSHQARMTNLLTRIGWEARAADPALHPGRVPTPGEEARIAVMLSGVAREVVDYLLFIDEAPLPAPVRGTSGFAGRFSARGPRDRRGRSLYELDLDRRLLKHPCSYLIYSPAFDALPPSAKEPVYRRMWEILSGDEQDPRYVSALSRPDRLAIVEILRDTKKDLPAYFQPVTK